MSDKDPAELQTSRSLVSASSPASDLDADGASLVGGGVAGAGVDSGAGVARVES